MEEIVVEHHETLQAKPKMTENRRNAIKEIKEKIKRKTSREEIIKALRKTANGMSPGTYGIPYELYKEILHTVINDIERNGVEKISSTHKKESEFTCRLMFLLFKKR
jgi:hypothetical protein